MVGLDEINLFIHGILSLASMIWNIHEWGASSPLFNLNIIATASHSRTF